MRMKVAEFLEDKHCDDEYNCLHILEELYEEDYIRLQNGLGKYGVFVRSDRHMAFIFVCYTSSCDFISESEIDYIRSMCEEYEVDEDEDEDDE